MKITTVTCDIENGVHTDFLTEEKLPVRFDYDQDDGRTKMEPYWELIKLDICSNCYSRIVNDNCSVSGYGAMGFNNYKIIE